MKIRTYLYDRPLLLGALVSLLWHLFWFFSVTITVGPSDRGHRRPTHTVSLGAVLDDTIFKTLVESRPRATEAFYRHMSDFAPEPAEPEVSKMDRIPSGGVVSVPFGRKFITSLKEFIDGDKPSPEPAFNSGLEGSFGRKESFEGQIKDRTIVSRPARPDLLGGTENGSSGTESVVGFSVDRTGTVLDAEIIVSSGDRAVDAAWLEYVRGLRFSASAAAIQKGKVRLGLR